MPITKREHVHIPEEQDIFGFDGLTMPTHDVYIVTFDVDGESREIVFDHATTDIDAIAAMEESITYWQHEAEAEWYHS